MWPSSDFRTIELSTCLGKTVFLLEQEFAMQRIQWLTIGVLVCALGPFVQAEETKPRSSASAADAGRIAREEEKQILKALSQRIKFECTDMPLDEAVKEVCQKMRCDFLFDTTHMSDEGISTDVTVTLKIGDLTAWQTLHFLLEPLMLTWVANDGVLEITTTAHASELLVTRVYDIHNLCRLLEPLARELLAQPPRGKAHPMRGGAGMMGGMGGGGMGGGGFFSVPHAAVSTGVFAQFGGMGVQPNQGPVMTRSIESIIAAMIVNCTTLPWLEREGEGGSIQLGQGCLIVSQTYRGQFEIAGIIQALEQFVDGKAQGKSIAARRVGYPVEEEARIFETLAKRKSIEVEDGSIMEVIQKIASDNGLPFWFDLQMLSDEGISTDALIGTSRKMQKLPLAICLKKILEPFHLVAVVDEGVLVITTQSRADEMMSVKFYDIGGISKIANEDPTSGVVSVLSRSTHGQWQETEGEGGSASLVSSKHLAVLQTQQVHTEIALLIDDLTKDELVVPAEPAMELRAYTVPTADTARDLERVLPQLLGPRWSARGTVRQAGTSLLVTQPSAVHDSINEILEKLQQSYQEKNPNGQKPTEPEDDKVKKPGSDQRK